MKVVSVLQVAEPGVWAELGSVADLGPYTAEVLDPLRRVVLPSFERDVLPSLKGRVLVRYARREVDPEVRTHLAEEVAALRGEVRKVLISTQRHALDDVVIGRQAWDPEHHATAVRALLAGELLSPLPGEAAPYEGRYQLHPDLPAPPPIPYDFTDAVMDETEDLGPAEPGPVDLLHDVASLAAALEHVEVRVTHGGTIAQADARRVAERLAATDLGRAGTLEAHPRWGRALRGLHALGVVTIEPITRGIHLDLGLETTLAGDTEEATDRLVHRLVDRDLHPVVPALREALRQAGPGAVDEVVFLELLRDQHRDVLIPAWLRHGAEVYPHLPGEALRLWDDEGFEKVEARMVGAVLGRVARFGLIRRAPGVFAGTADGRRWARAVQAPRPPIWVSGDLEIIVPPDALTVWERFQVERLGRCLQRDVVDRYRLERSSLERWLSTHDVGEALDLLARRCPGVPASARDALETWARSAQRAVLTRGVVLP